MRFKPPLVLVLGILLLFPAFSTQDFQFSGIHTTTIGPITITHTPLKNASVGKPIQLNATVNSTNSVSSVKLFYKIWNASSFNEIKMTLVSGDLYNGIWNSTIPGQNQCLKLFYYLWANDTKGNSVTEPKNISNPFEVSIVDTQPPMIYHLYVWESSEGSPIPIWAIVTDDVGVRNVTLYYRKSKEPSCHPLQMNISEGDSSYANWTATIPQQTGGVLWYWINATDGTNNATTGNISIIVEPKYSEPPEKDWLTIMTISLCIALLIIAVILFKANRKSKRKKKTKPVRPGRARD